MLQTALLIVLVISCVSMIGLILIQQGKGADVGAAFGSGASNSVFGSQGSGNFLTRVTSALAAVFFICCLALAWNAKHAAKSSVVDFSGETELKEVPDAGAAPSSDVPVSGDKPVISVDVPPAAPEMGDGKK